MLQKYAAVTLKLMNRQELNEFYKKLLKKWKFQQKTKKTIYCQLSNFYLIFNEKFAFMGLKIHCFLFLERKVFK
jgi:hypothetical protein